MHLGPKREVDGLRRCEPWEQVVAGASAHDHIVQLYEDQNFLNSAVCRYIGAGLANGDSIVVFPTLTHWIAFRERLEAEGVEVQTAQECGQLTVVDANELLPRFMRDAMPDPQVFNAVIGEIFRQARPGGSYQKDAGVGRTGRRPVGARGRRRQHDP
jgi:MEDS: MEthanogen/methylotroph, DcmR Sensory domain